MRLLGDIDEKSWLVAIFFVVSFSTAVLHAQDIFLQHWKNRVNDIQSKQPVWPVPVVTAYPCLMQLLRTDVLRDITASGAKTWNYDNSRGVDLIPWRNTEIDIDLPPYVQHNSPNEQDGFGDLTMQYKYRLFSGNEHHGAYAVSASLAGDVPTGSHTNGSAEATLTPTLYAGKGFGAANIQSSIGATLPVSETATLGRPIVWNTALQYKVRTILWPEVELNSTFIYCLRHQLRKSDPTADLTSLLSGEQREIVLEANYRPTLRSSSFGPAAFRTYQKAFAGMFIDQVEQP